MNRRLNEDAPLCTCTRTRCVITTISLVTLFALTIVIGFRCDIISFAGKFSSGGSENNLSAETSGLWQRLIKKSAKVERGWSRSAL